MKPVKFVQITRTICPKTLTHYLYAIDSDGTHWMAQMTHQEEPWIIYKQTWKKDPQQP